MIVHTATTISCRSAEHRAIHRYFLCRRWVDDSAKVRLEGADVDEPPSTHVALARLSDKGDGFKVAVC
jgi:hypothetical protein